jgi:GR25 family glycosyltransferase involved in LPS biosynthesis
MPLHYAMISHPTSFKDRQKFCAFVVSNPICQMRNDAFQCLTQYKQVSSGGAYQNNIGGQLHLKYPGGGCGDISKHHFFGEHQFTLSFENSQSPGYITEKLLHAKMAGCIPLYWGSQETDFNPQSFVNLSNMTSPTKIVEVVKRLEANPEMCAKIAATPPLDELRKQAALHTISAMAKKLFEVATSLHTVPKTNQLIDKIYLINLDSRADRLQTFTESQPNLDFTRISAINGKQLQLSDTLYNLCKKNHFQWKKSVIACALSHISVWNKIVNENATYSLILEDDMRFKSGWQDKIKDIPHDADLLYLGGVLPANRPALPHALDKVNEYWSKIKPNTFFTKEPSSTFHFCAYSYIVTKRGAQKLLDYLHYSQDKLCIPCDHLINHPIVGLTKYVTNELLTFCFQENDSQYSDSQFNDLHTEKKFDSDIYNNTECFSEADLSVYVNPPLVKTFKPVQPVIFCYISPDKPELYEITWLEDIFQKSIYLMPLTEYKPIHTNVWFLVQRPYLDQWTIICKSYDDQKIPYQIIHLSDEFGTDSVALYNYSMCKKVIRNYLRKDLQENSNVTIIPLGYHHKQTESLIPIQQRKLMWSFHGTDWFNRGEQLKQFMSYTPYHCHLQPQWNDPSRIKKQDYLAHLGNSKFCPILKGNNMETFRLYEALEAGTLPVSVEKNEYTDWIDVHMNLSELYDWTNPTMNKPITELIQIEVMKRWIAWKESLKKVCQC